MQTHLWPPVTHIDPPATDYGPTLMVPLSGSLALPSRYVCFCRKKAAILLLRQLISSPYAARLVNPAARVTADGHNAFRQELSNLMHRQLPHVFWKINIIS